MLTPTAGLRLVKVAHTIVWAFFVACILIIPVGAWRRDFALVAVLTGIVLFEVVVLLANGWRCPLTLVAERYTDDRKANFDIYLPLWLARNNKTVFGWLFIGALVFAILRWRMG